jgi:hypothetical protein
MPELIDRYATMDAIPAPADADEAEYYGKICDVIETIPAVNRWIPCSEMLPEKDTSVIIYAAGHRVSAYYDAVKGVFRLTESDDLFYLRSAVTHWMPMPEPPNGGAGNAV